MSATANKNSAAWLRAEIKLLYEQAKDNAKLDAENAANGDSDERDRYLAMSECAAHYAKSLRRILSGKTWEEALAAKLAGMPRR